MDLNKIYNMDCIEGMKLIPDNSIDSIVTDPPYELGFMGKSWDSTGIAYNKDMRKECLRVLKPGGHLLSFSGTRTYHRMAVAIEDAGFEVRDMIEWVYGSGFPKSLNIGKAVDKLQGNERKSDGNGNTNCPYLNRGEECRGHGEETSQSGLTIHAPKTKGTSEWEGRGTSLKPAHEPICMARKPLSEKNVAENCLKWGTGGINIDVSRVDYNGETPNIGGRANHTRGDGYGFKELKENINPNTTGRFPANLIHDNSEEVRECFPNAGKGNGGKPYNYAGKEYNNKDTSMFNGDKPQAPSNFNDSGNASRFFKSIIYQAKASKSERDKGCEGLPIKQTTGGGGMNNTEDDVCGKYGSIKSEGHNNHPTVKPIALMEYLIKMITKKGGIVLDPFAGSGTTLVAAKQNGFQYVGFELTDEYIPIIEARVNAANNS